MDAKFTLVRHGENGARQTTIEQLEMPAEEASIINVALCKAKSSYRLWAYQTPEQIREKYKAMNERLKEKP